MDSVTVQDFWGNIIRQFPRREPVNLIDYRAQEGYYPDDDE